MSFYFVESAFVNVIDLTRPDFCLQFFVVITLKLPNQFVMGNVEPDPCWVKRKGVRCPFAFVMVQSITITLLGSAKLPLSFFL